MEIQLREAKLTDYKAIQEISKYALGYDCLEEQVKSQLEQIIVSDREKLYVAVCKEQVVGYIHAENYLVLYFPPMKNLLGFAVHQDYQKQGIGTQLLNEVEKWAKESGACGVRLNSSIARKEAHEFYRHHGYTIEKEQIRFIKAL